MLAIFQNCSPTLEKLQLSGSALTDDSIAAIIQGATGLKSFGLYVKQGSRLSAGLFESLAASPHTTMEVLILSLGLNQELAFSSDVIEQLPNVFPSLHTLTLMGHLADDVTGDSFVQFVVRLEVPLKSKFMLNFLMQNFKMLN